jgi:rare lipoprotein A (peptidoglycan hydrolase)
MIAQATMTRRLPAIRPAAAAPIRLAPALQSASPVPAPLNRRNLAATLAIVAAGFVCAAVVLGAITYQQARRDVTGIESVRNETVVVRRAISPVETPDETPSWNLPRLVRTVSFFAAKATRSLVTATQRGPTDKPYSMNGRRYVPTDNSAYRAEGVASWYGPDFHGRKTANGERYDMNGISAAHRTMPLPSYARVTNLQNGRSIIVRVNNRGPFVHNRIADLSVGTAKALDFYKKGTARVRVEFVARAPKEGGDDQMLLATLREGAPAPAPANVVTAAAQPSLTKTADAK